MSDDTTPDTEVHLDTDLLELDKRVSRSSTDYPVFEYRIDYNGSPPGELTISESLPPGVAPDDVEFHPDFYGENWTCREDRVEFDYILPDSEVVETKFGLSVDDPEIAEALAAPPEVLVDDLETGDRIATYEPDDAQTLTPEDGEGMQPVEPDPVSDTVRDIILGSKEDVTGSDDSDDAEEPLVVEPGGGDAGDSGATSAAAAPDAAVAAGASDGDADGSSAVATPPPETEDVDEGEGPGEDATGDAPAADGPAAPDDDTPAEPPTDDDGEGPDAEAAAGDDGAEPSADDGTDAADDAEGDASGGAVGGVAPASVGQALAEELRAGAIPDEDVAVLREHLDVGLSESDRVRLEDLQSRYHDLLAYTDALEAFIDEHGDADGVLAELQSDVADVEDELERLSAVGERVEDELAAYPDADDLQERLDGLASDLNDTQETVEAELADLTDRLADLEATVDDLEEQTEVLLELQDVFGGD